MPVRNFKKLEEAFLNSLPSNLPLAYPFSLTVRFSLTEYVAGRSSGDPHATNNEFWFITAQKSFFLFLVASVIFYLFIFLSGYTITLERLNQSEPNFHTRILAEIAWPCTKMGVTGHMWPPVIGGFYPPLPHLKFYIPPISTIPNQIFTHEFWLE